MGQFSSLVVAVSLALYATPVRAAENEQPLVMAPISDWVVDYADKSCALRRAFANEDEKAVLELRQYGPGDRIEVAVLSDTVSRTRGSPRTRFEPASEWSEPPAANFIDAGSYHGVIYDDTLRLKETRPEEGPLPEWPDEDRKTREQAVTGITITNSFERDLTLQTGKLHAPMEAMRTCLQDLVSQWGIDQGVPGPLARGPTPLGIASWSRRTLEAYPTDMLRAGKSARVPVRLVVGKDGRVKSCHPNGFAEPSFLEAACDSMMRYARFNPAVDGNGEPADGTYVTTIVYQTF